jgi:Na+/H+ antiporter NhaD/arsenite permease-like protein
MLYADVLIIWHKVGAADPKYVSFCCINIVVASNAGGAFSPFGDVTTLMVWQKGKLQFGDFAKLMLPSLVNWLIPAFILVTRHPSSIPLVIINMLKAVEHKGKLQFGDFAKLMLPSLVNWLIPAFILVTRHSPRV